MYINNNSAFLYSAPEDKSFAAQSQPAERRAVAQASLENFSEKAILTFANLTSEFTVQERETAKEALSSIGKAAAFASTNGFESQNERNVVSQYYGNFSGVLSDEAIKKMIHAKLDNPNYDNRVFLEKFAKALDEPLKGINIKV
jgi:hypothetical protein